MRRDRYLLFFALGVSAFALACACELGARLFVKPQRQIVAYDPEFGWRYLPRLSVKMGDAAFETNSLGIRDREHAAGPAPGTFRVLVMGDSYVAAVGVPEEKTFVRKAEGGLNAVAAAAKARPVEVLVGAVSAWSTDQQLLFWRSIGRHWRPDVTLLLVSPNDIRESYAKKIFALDKAGALAGPLDMPRRIGVFDRAFWFLLNHSAFAQWAAMKLGRGDSFPILARYFPFNFLVNGRDSNDWELYYTDPEPAYDGARDLFAALLAQLGSEVRAAGSELVVAVVPARIEWGFPMTVPTHMRPARVADFVKGLAAREKISYLDLRARLPDNDPDRQLLYRSDEYHFNEAGHAYVAEEITRALSGRVRVRPASRPLKNVP